MGKENIYVYNWIMSIGITLLKTCNVFEYKTHHVPSLTRVRVWAS